MATLIPAEINEIMHDGERDLARNLRDNLPDKWTIIHGRNFLTQDARLGETDFLIINPQQGLLVVETKSGDLKYDAISKFWYHIDHDGIKRKLKSRDPLSQASGNMFEIKTLITQQYPSAFDLVTIGFAIALPESTYEGNLPPNLHPDLVLTEPNCIATNIRRSIEKAFAFFRTSDVHVGDQWVQQVLNVLYPSYRIMPLRHRVFEGFERKLHRLTEEQMRVLDYTKNIRKAAFKGGAGTGKTMLAVAKAQLEAQAGKRVLLLCYNAALKTWLQRSYETNYGNGSLKIDTYHGLVEEFAKKFQKPWNPSTTRFWNTTAADLLFEIGIELPDKEKFDSIIIDEGQDFRSNWWDSIGILLRGPSQEQSWFIFYDPKQNLFSEQVTLPAEITTPAFELSVNCRNTRKIGEHVANLIGTTSEYHSDAPLGENPTFIRSNNVGDAVSKAISLAQDMINDGFQLKQICILLYNVPVNEEQRINKLDKFTNNETLWWDDKGILVCSIRRFKGLEADRIIIVEDQVKAHLASDSIEDTISMRYVARSRAKFSLTIIQTPNAR